MESWNRKWRVREEEGGFLAESQRLPGDGLLSALFVGLQTLWCWSSVYVGWKIAQAKGRSLPEDKKASFWEQRHEHFASLVWNNIRELRGEAEFFFRLETDGSRSELRSREARWRACLFFRLVGQSGPVSQHAERLAASAVHTPPHQAARHDADFAL